VDNVKKYFLQNFEQTFVLVILLSVAAITYFVPYKLAFLNFFFIPILMAAYYLDIRRALLGAVFCIIMVSIYAYFNPLIFRTGNEGMDIALNITTWGSFLILTAALVTRLHEKLQFEVAETRKLNAELADQHAKLEAAGVELKDYADNLEQKVTERTEKLEQSRQTIEQLKEKVEEALYSTMDAEVAKLIIEDRLRTEKRKISVLFADLAGFTTYSEERQPEIVIGELNAYLADMEEVIHDFRGHIDKYVGDGIMVEFGAPIDYERHALQAVVAGMKMQEHVAKLKMGLKMRIGIATGEPLIGLIGRRRQSYTAIGDVVNTAARIEESCTPGKVTVDEPTYDEVKGFFDFDRKTVFPLSEFEDPEYVKTMEKYFRQLDEEPRNVEVMRKIGFLSMHSKDYNQAHDYFKRALELEPDDDRVKVAFAETTMKLDHMDKIEIRGKRKRLHLYEVTVQKDPFAKRVPAKLLEKYAATVRGLADYPEELLAPIECLDGALGRSRVVGFISYVLADLMKLPDQDKKDALLAGYFADLGKTIVPHHILNRAGTLSRAEVEEVRKHPREGVRVLMKLGYQENEGLHSLVGSHHENPNGTGYPDGLKGDKIPPGARIIAVAEQYEALTAWRPYRDAWQPSAALRQIEDDTRKGKFDPAVVQLLRNALS
jgi:HD-GYP domain-containing protein (c-di-GMP phosphodiesterase class II)